MVAALTPAEAELRRRRVRGTTLRLALFAVAVYIGYIIAIINR
jgi:hypothetical protein